MSDWKITVVHEDKTMEDGVCSGPKYDDFDAVLAEVAKGWKGAKLISILIQREPG